MLPRQPVPGPLGACTVSQSKRSYIRQPLFYCNTCQVVNGLCLCAECAEKCHRAVGHDVTGPVEGWGYCDCGADWPDRLVALGQSRVNDHTFAIVSDFVRHESVAKIVFEARSQNDLPSALESPLNGGGKTIKPTGHYFNYESPHLIRGHLEYPLSEVAEGTDYTFHYNSADFSGVPVKFRDDDKKACMCCRWEEAMFADYKSEAEKEVERYQEYLKRELGEGCPPITMDWDSFEQAESPNRTWPRMMYSYNFYRLYDVVWFFVRSGGDMARSKINSLKEFHFRHVNAGLPHSERCVVEDGRLLLMCSYCCWEHLFDFEDVQLGLLKGLDLFEPLRVAMRNEAGEVSTKYSGVPIELDFESFEMPDIPDENERAKRKVDAYLGATSCRCWYSIRRLEWARTCTRNVDPTADEMRSFFSRIVIHNKTFLPWLPNPDGWMPWWKRLYTVKYDTAAKQMNITNCFEKEYDQCASYWDIGEVLAQVVGFSRLPDFAAMTEEQHQEKVRLMEIACTSYELNNGDLSWIRELLRMPCFYPKDAHEMRAAEILLEYVNSKKYRLKMPADTLAFETRALAAHGLPPDAPEQYVASWLVTKINYRGMRQDRFVVLTDRATYTCVPTFKGKQAEEKRVHRLPHQYYSYVEVAELRYDNIQVGGGAVGRAANTAQDAANSGAGRAIAGALGFQGPPHGIRIKTNRLQKEEKKSKFKAPTIPGLKENILKFLRTVLGLLEAVPIPEIPPLPGPKITVQMLLRFLQFCRPRRYVASERANSCAPGLPAEPNAYALISKLIDALKAENLPEPKIRLPKLDPVAILRDIIDKLEANTEFIITLPEKFHITDILEDFVKQLSKMSGLDNVKLPGMPKFTAVDCVDLIIETVKEHPLPEIEGFPPIPLLLSKIRDAAADWKDPDMPKLPDFGIKNALQKIVEILKSVDLPAMPEINLPGIKMPKLPVPSIPGAPALPNLGQSAKESPWLESLSTPLLPPPLSGCSKYVCLEIAWAVHAAARAYHMEWVSTPWRTSTMRAPQTALGGLYNSSFRGSIGSGVAKKPTGPAEVASPPGSPGGAAAAPAPAAAAPAPAAAAPAPAAAAPAPAAVEEAAPAPAAT